MASKQEAEERLRAALADRYAIEREIGEGGMATVYLAEDLKHHRQVALKVLKPELAAVLGAERFLSEIKTTAHLQHPNILPLFDSGGAGGLLFYVMPYVEGESLRDRLDREKQLPVDEAVRLASEVAEALQAAHDDGIIHRDIKPANILLRKGKPLVADFGIALAVSAAGGGRLTETGLSLGTPYYMSPEQASADREPTAASDVYSLGSVLYEMLTGEPPFPGSTAQAVLAKILTGDAIRPTEHRNTIPANVECALLKALEKLPADRFRTATEFSKALADPGFRWGDAAGEVATQAGSWRAAALGLGGLGAILVAVLAWMAFLREPPRPVEYFSLPTEGAKYSDLSPAGNGIAYIIAGEDGENRLWFRSWDDPDLFEIPGTVGAYDVDLSPDGTQVVFFNDKNELIVADIRGGSQSTVYDSTWNTVEWSRDGFIYFEHELHGMSRVPAMGGEVEVITVPETEVGGHAPHSLSEDGKVLLFKVLTRPRRMEALKLDSGERKEVVLAIKAVFTSEGFVVFVTADGALKAAPFDTEALEFSARPEILIPEIGFEDSGDPAFSLSADGTLAYWTAGSGSGAAEFVWVDDEGRPTPVQTGWSFLPGGGQWASWDLSPDGEKIAYRDVSGDYPDIWILDLVDGVWGPLTRDATDDIMPQWGPAGEEVTFLSNRNVMWTRWKARFDLTRPADSMPGFEGFSTEVEWSPDGGWMVFAAGEYEGVRDILGLRPGIDSVPLGLVATEDDETMPALSPDGRWLAYVSDRSGQRQVYISPFPETTGPSVQVSFDGGRQPVWAPESDRLFYLSEGGSPWDSREMWVAALDPVPSLRIANREQLFTLPRGFFFGEFHTTYSVTEDDAGGVRFLMAREVGGEEGAESRIMLVRNWTELLKDIDWQWY